MFHGLALRGQSILLETIGVVGAQGLYAAYTAIGSVADANNGGIYTSEFTVQLMEEYSDLMRSSEVQLEKLLASNALSAPDALIIEKMELGYQFLRLQALAYKSYLESQDPRLLDTYDTHRKAAWEVISQLMGF